MVDEFKTIRDNLFKAIMGGDDAGPDDGGIHDDDSRRYRADASAAKAIIASMFARAGKGKDEVVQTVAREIGVAVAAMLKEPLAALAKNQKLQISFEFVPKTGKGGREDPEVTEEKTTKASPRKPSTKKRSRS